MEYERKVSSLIVASGEKHFQLKVTENMWSGIIWVALCFQHYHIFVVPSKCGAIFHPKFSSYSNKYDLYIFHTGEGRQMIYYVGQGPVGGPEQLLQFNSKQEFVGV